MKLKELTNEEFQTFTDNYTLSSVFQTPEYAMVMNKQNYDTFYLGMVDDNGSIVAASLILVELLGKFQYAYAPRGYLLDYQNEELVREFTKQIKKFLGSKNIMAIKICPMITRSIAYHDGKEKIVVDSYEKTYEMLKKMQYYHLGYNHFFEAFKPRFEAVIDLDTNISQMFQNVKKEFRTKIRMSDRNGVRIYRGNFENLSFFYQMTKNKYKRNQQYFQEVLDQYGKRNMVDLYFALLDTKQFLVNAQRELQKQSIENNKITEIIFKNQGKASNRLIARKIVEDNKLAERKKELVYATNLLNRHPEGILLACAMVVKQKEEAYLLMDGYDSQYKRLNAKHLLIWKLMEKYANDGYKTFNLGGIANPANSGTYQGLDEFRLGFGAAAKEYIGDLEYITNRPLYMMYRNMAPFRSKKKS